MPQPVNCLVFPRGVKSDRISRACRRPLYREDLTAGYRSAKIQGGQNEINKYEAAGIARLCLGCFYTPRQRFWDI